MAGGRAPSLTLPRCDRGEDFSRAATRSSRFEAHDTKITDVRTCKVSGTNVPSLRGGRLGRGRAHRRGVALRVVSDRWAVEARAGLWPAGDPSLALPRCDRGEDFSRAATRSSRFEAHDTKITDVRTCKVSGTNVPSLRGGRLGRGRAHRRGVALRVVSDRWVVEARAGLWPARAPSLALPRCDRGEDTCIRQDGRGGTFGASRCAGAAELAVPASWLRSGWR